MAEDGLPANWFVRQIAARQLLAPVITDYESFAPPISRLVRTRSWQFTIRGARNSALEMAWHDAPRSGHSSNSIHFKFTGSLAGPVRRRSSRSRPNRSQCLGRRRSQKYIIEAKGSGLA